MVDTRDLKSLGHCARAGSSPAFGTSFKKESVVLCSILRISVSMHNIADKDIFRPAAWNAFGMDKEGADYRACQNFGPIYQ